MTRDFRFRSLRFFKNDLKKYTNQGHSWDENLKIRSCNVTFAFSRQDNKNAQLGPNRVFTSVKTQKRNPKQHFQDNKNAQLGRNRVFTSVKRKNAIQYNISRQQKCNSIQQYCLLSLPAQLACLACLACLAYLLSLLA